MTVSHVYRIYVSEFLFVQNTHQTWLNLFNCGPPCSNPLPHGATGAPNLFTWGQPSGPGPTPVQSCLLGTRAIGLRLKGLLVLFYLWQVTVKYRLLLHLSELSTFWQVHNRTRRQTRFLKGTLPSNYHEFPDSGALPYTPIDVHGEQSTGAVEY